MEEKIPIMDLIMLIDATASMDCMVEYFNKNLADCIRCMNQEMNMFSKNVKVRAKIVLFRALDSEGGFLEVSPLFDASDLRSIYQYALTLKAYGGHDLVEDGLTALFEALKIDDPYDYEQYSYHRRRIILFTDNDSKLPTLPSCPHTLEEFASLLTNDDNEYGIDTEHLGLIFFVPKNTRYTELAKLTNNQILVKSYGEIGDGMMGLLWNDPYYIMSFFR